MRTKGGKYSIPSKPIVLTIFFILIFVLVIFLRSSTIPKSHQTQSLTSDLKTSCPPINHQLPTTLQTCNKLPTATAETLVHYVTSNITPQQTYKEISVSLRVLNKKSPCNFLVFGLGYDSPMWASLNQGGRTVFLEEDKSWIQQIQGKFPTLESFHVVYDTKVSRASDLMEIGKRDECKVIS